MLFSYIFVIIIVSTGAKVFSDSTSTVPLALQARATTVLYYHITKKLKLLYYSHRAILKRPCEQYYCTWHVETQSQQQSPLVVPQTRESQGAVQQFRQFWSSVVFPQWSLKGGIAAGALHIIWQMQEKRIELVSKLRVARIGKNQKLSLGMNMV